MNTKYKTVEITRICDNVLLLTLNRPHASNAFNTKMSQELFDIFMQIETEPQIWRAVILTGKGDRAFSAGADLKERDGMTVVEWSKQHLKFEKMIDSILRCKIPTLGAINGAAIGGGCELVAALDFAYASETAIFGQTETKIGIIPGIGGTQTLSRAVGERRAKEIIFSARTFTAVEAHSWGLINSIFPSNLLLEKISKIAIDIAANAPLAVKNAKLAIHEGLQVPLKDGMKVELKYYNKTISTKDREEGVLAFNEKRKPIFKGS